MIGLFLGAGFSKWSANLPLARQLFDFQVQPFGIREESRLRLVIDLKEDWDRKHSSEPSEKFVADGLLLPERPRRAILWYIVRRLSEPFIWIEFHGQRWRRHVLMFDEYRKYEIEGVKRAQDFLRRVGMPLAGIITTNYDVLVEYALGTGGFNYGIHGQRLAGRGAYPLSQWNNPVTTTGTLPLAKLHGRVSWDDNFCYTDGRRGLSGDALIVAPTPEKRPPSKLESHWHLSASILRETTSLLVFGFAFNPYDEAILEHLKNNGQHIRSVILIDVAPNLDAARALWPMAVLSSAPPPPAGDEVTNEWLQAQHL